MVQCRARFLDPRRIITGAHGVTRTAVVGSGAARGCRGGGMLGRVALLWGRPSPPPPMFPAAGAPPLRPDWIRPVKAVYALPFHEPTFAPTPETINLLSPTSSRPAPVTETEP